MSIATSEESDADYYITDDERLLDISIDLYDNETVSPLFIICDRCGSKILESACNEVFLCEICCIEI